MKKIKVDYFLDLFVILLILSVLFPPFFGSPLDRKFIFGDTSITAHISKLDGECVERKFEGMFFYEWWVLELGILLIAIIIMVALKHRSKKNQGLENES